MRTGPEELLDHLQSPRGRGRCPDGAFTGAAGGAACGDLIRVSLAIDTDGADGAIVDAGFDASGCGATFAAGSAAVSLLRGRSLLDAARIGPADIAEELGGLSHGKRHAAELAADALHRALGGAARHRAALSVSAGRTLVAMSGGVDSAVAALLIARQAEAVGVTLELWSDPENDGDLSCCSAQAVRGARELAHRIGMPHLSIDLRAEFRAGVVDGWLSDHARGLTPNPCVRCNGRVRLDAMIDLADRLGCETLATGHYARVQAADGADRPLLRMAADERKDQSYVLAALSPRSLARMRFPLGDMPKTEVRRVAAEAGLAVARKRDSQDLCFLAGTRHADFLERHAGLGRRPGPIVDLHGSVLGQHGGAHAFTIGQRHGLGIGSTAPLYVLSTDVGSNTVTVGPRERLLTGTIEARDLTLRCRGDRVDAVRVRSHGERIACGLSRRLAAGRHEKVQIELARPAERTAPGQIACLYSGDLVAGYATVAA
ncbi:MAG TPA: tRNA 2-thiouridine(34) synthase MnmA [Solirubrobacteraceae bacterium]